MTNGSASPENDDFSLPFDLRTVFIALLQRRLAILVVGLVAIVCGVAAGFFLGSKLYRAQTVLLYRPAGGSGGSGLSQSLSSLLNQVKVRPAIELLRERLRIPATLDRLGRSIDVDIPENSTLLVIRATWNDAQKVAEMANIMRDIFLESWCRSLLRSLASLHEQAKTKLDLARNQENSYAKVVEELRDRAKDEREQLADGSGDINVRYARVREMIDEDRRKRANRVDLAARQAEFERGKRLRDKSLISDAEFDAIASAYNRQRAITSDTVSTARWRRELEELRKQSQTPDVGATPSETMIQDVMVRALSAEIERIALEEQVTTIAVAEASAKARLDEIAASMRERHLAPNTIARISDDLLSIQNNLATVRGLYETESTEFTLVSTASPPINSIKSTRRLLAAVVAFVIGLLGIGWLVLRVLFAPALRSSAEMALKLGSKVIGHVPAFGKGGAPSPEIQEAYRLLARSLRHEVPGDGAAIVLTGLRGSEGSTTLCAQLGAVLGSLEGRVLLIDVAGERSGVSEMALREKAPAEGLGRWLRDDGVSHEQIITSSTVAGVFVLPHDRKPSPPDRLGSQRFGELMGVLSKEFRVILIDTGPVLLDSTAVFAAQWCDAALIVGKVGVTRGRDLPQAVARMDTSGVARVLGVLNASDSAYDS